MKKQKPRPKLSPQSSKLSSNQFMQSDKEMNANEKKAGYDNEGAFGIGMIKGVK